jgi:hypothetical protein
MALGDRLRDIVKPPMAQDFKETVMAKLSERGIRPLCEVCGHNNWAVVDQPISIVVGGSSSGFSIPLPQIPAAGLICNNCGNVRLFALGALGL